MVTAQRAKEMLQGRSRRELIELFEETELRAISEDNSIVRGWIMDELEWRDGVAFDRWLDSNEVSPRSFFLPSRKK